MMDTERLVLVLNYVSAKYPEAKITVDFVLLL